MIDASALLTDLRRQLTLLEHDIRSRQEELPDLKAQLILEHRDAVNADRCGLTFEVWRDERITQSAAAWLLAVVFVRFCEDNGLIPHPLICDTDSRNDRALTHQNAFFAQNPLLSERHYLESVFQQMADYPAAAALFGKAHNPLWLMAPSGNGALAVLDFFRARDPKTGELVHNFTDPSHQTRFLGDLYQDLSPAARKKYALLQTPDFVESFILDHTLEPAITNFGLAELRMIDPTCGAGHFLLGAFERLFESWCAQEPATDRRNLAARAMAAIHGVDLNPFAVAIARFRLLIAFLNAAVEKNLVDAPFLDFNLAVGDSLLHGPVIGEYTGRQEAIPDTKDDMAYVYKTEDADLLRRILGQRYHAVVGNPPYITVKDKALRDAYRDRYHSCYREYSLSVPFMERFFQLAVPGDKQEKAGYVGKITSNSFMKREFGKTLIQKYIPRWDLTHVIDTSGAYIPGHGTPTVILFGRNQEQVSSEVLAVLGIRGEPSIPEVPAKGLVWLSIIKSIQQLDFESSFVNVTNMKAKKYHEHPWSLSGGGAIELKAHLDNISSLRLTKFIKSIGFMCITKEDGVFVSARTTFRTIRLEKQQLRFFGVGADVRNWGSSIDLQAIYPYDDEVNYFDIDSCPNITRYMWPFRTTLFNRKVFSGGTFKCAGRPWYAYGQIPKDRQKTPLSITFAFVATHNHFVLDRGGKLFKQTAPVIKLPVGATEDDHLKLLGLLNSSTACFWMKQVFFPKGGNKQGTWQDRFEHDGTKLKQFPVPASFPNLIPFRIDQKAQELSKALPSATMLLDLEEQEKYRKIHQDLLSEMIFLQEELDWQNYDLYGLLNKPLLYFQKNKTHHIQKGERAFEIVLARKMQAGHKTAWFERHDSTPITEIPDHWPEDYRALVQSRINEIENNPNINLIERPEYKRRWNTKPWDDQLKEALHQWLLDFLEELPLWQEPELYSCQRIAEEVAANPQFLNVAEQYTGRPDFNPTALVSELITKETVPLLPRAYLKPAGLRKYADWEETWRLQRLEDAIDAKAALPAQDPNHLTPQAAEAAKADLGKIPVPPKFTGADFLNTNLYRQRGKLNVPKERFVGFPGCEEDGDPTPVVGWAGWDHEQLAQAVGQSYFERRDSGWDGPKLIPFLACLQQLLPWLYQWHNAHDAELGMPLAAWYDNLITEETRAQELTPDSIQQWTPPKPKAKRKARTKKVTP